MAIVKITQRFRVVRTIKVDVPDGADIDAMLEDGAPQWEDRWEESWELTDQDHEEVTE